MSLTRSFHVISGPSTLTGTVASSASPARVSIWSGTLKRDILLLGGTWPPAGMKTTSGSSATGATSRTKGDSGDLVRRLIESSPGEQRKLWQELKRERRTQPTRFEQLSSTTRHNLKRLKSRRTYDGNGHLERSREEVELIEVMRARRRTLLFEVAEGWYSSNRTGVRKELESITFALYDLTMDEAYLLC